MGNSRHGYHQCYDDCGLFGIGGNFRKENSASDWFHWNVFRYCFVDGGYAVCEQFYHVHILHSLGHSLRRLLCRGSGFDPLVPCVRTFQPVSATSRHVYGCFNKLDRQLYCRTGLLTD
uniref:Uncharacterized protein n=1 Tax=Cacopsylla melanoneura TaxID=428564 RepID=A0A8D8UMW5_9HEMI